jgi:hypothetical protein
MSDLLTHLRNHEHLYSRNDRSITRDEPAPPLLPTSYYLRALAEGRKVKRAHPTKRPTQYHAIATFVRGE